MAEVEIDEATGVSTTGHSWDGIKELNNPLPRWWLILFYVSIAWSVVYWVFMPAWPGISGYTPGIRAHSERENVGQAMAALDAERGAKMKALLEVDGIADIEKDDALFQQALAAGQSLFGDNCATCHGAGGQGNLGYPALVDDAWLWGGSLDAIEYTLNYGIRAEHDMTRMNIMQAYGRDGILNDSEISDLVEYVVHISGREADAGAVERGAELFAVQCVACHGENGAGIQELGAPNLTDAIWLYGGDRAALSETLHNGRAGVMPYWSDRLPEEQIVALSVYVHSLGGGQ